MDMNKLKIEYLPVEDLEEYKNNTRKHGSEDVDQIVKSIEKFGFDDPIGIWSDHNVIVEGHGRLMAAKKLGMNTVPCIRLDHLTDEERREYGIMHNRTAELSDWDIEKLTKELEDLDLSDFDLNIGEGVEAEVSGPEEVVEDQAPEVKQGEPKSQLGEIYKLGDHYLMCGDSTNPEDVKRLMGGAKADMVFTDPPYGVSYVSTNNTNGRSWDMIKNDDLRGDGLYKFLIAAFENIRDSLKLGGAFYIWYANSNSVEFCQAIKDVGLKQKQILVWQKGMVLGRSDYHWTYEPCIYGCHPEQNSTWYGDRTQTPLWELRRTDIKELKKEDAIDMLLRLYDDKDVWEINRDPSNTYVHPTQKPVALSTKAIWNSSKTGDIVLDLFGGSGSTLMGCEQTKRKCRMMEFDPHYVDVIIERWENFTNKKAEKVTEVETTKDAEALFKADIDPAFDIELDAAVNKMQKEGK